MWVVFLGPPGCGKGSQAAYFVEKHMFSAICAGDLIRENRGRVIDDKGRTIGDLVNQGILLPDSVTTAIVTEEVDKVTGDNVLFDGYPRTIMQVHALESLAKSKGKKIDCMINFKIDEDIIMKRISGRFQCATCGRIYNKYFLDTKVEGVCDVCGGSIFNHRADDNEETLRKRLKEYSEKTYPLIDFYSRAGVLYNVQADDVFEKVTESIVEVLNKKENE